MPPQTEIDSIRKIKKTHENITVFIGIAIGLVLAIYFFTFAMLIDTGSWLIKFEMISSVLMIVALFFLKRISFVITKILLGRYKNLLDALTVSDLEKDEQKILEQLNQTVR